MNDAAFELEPLLRSQLGQCKTTGTTGYFFWDMLPLYSETKDHEALSQEDLAPVYSHIFEWSRYYPKTQPLFHSFLLANLGSKNFSLIAKVLEKVNLQPFHLSALEGAICGRLLTPFYSKKDQVQLDQDEILRLLKILPRPPESLELGLDDSRLKLMVHGASIGPSSSRSFDQECLQVFGFNSRGETTPIYK